MKSTKSSKLKRWRAGLCSYCNTHIITTIKKENFFLVSNPIQTTPFPKKTYLVHREGCLHKFIPLLMDAIEQEYNGTVNMLKLVFRKEKEEGG